MALRAAGGTSLHHRCRRLLAGHEAVPRQLQIAQEPGHLVEDRGVVAQVGEHQPMAHVFVERAQIAGQFAAGIRIEGATQALLDDADGLGDAASLACMVAGVEAVAAMPMALIAPS
jgi:sulfopyruvate decarboxylase TPP-binding subunit